MKFENSLKNSHYDLSNKKKFNIILIFCIDGLSNSVSILENEHPDYMNIIVRYEKLAKTIIDELKINHNMINEIIEKFKIVFFSKYDFSIITKKFLKKIDKSQFSKIKSDIFQDLKFYLIKPLYKIIKFLFKLILGTDALEKLETSNKNKLKMIIYDLTHKIIFKVNYKIYEIIIMFLNEATKSQKNQLKSQQLSLKKYKFIESFDVDKEFSFHTTTRNSTGYYGGELYLNAIEKVKSIEKKLTPFRKLDTVSTIHHNLWGSILKSHENNDSKEFMELRAKLDADNLISLYSYVIFNSKNCYLHREISFIEEFLEEKILNNYDYLYYFEMFKSALEYITNHISDN